MNKPSSLFRRLMLGFSAVIALVALAGFTYVAVEAKITQRARTASENAAHTREVLLHLAEIGDDRARMQRAAAMLEAVRREMFRELDYHSRVRLRVWQHGALVYNSLPDLPDLLPEAGSAEAGKANAWVNAVERDATSGLVVERSHEVDDEWMLSFSGVSFLLSSTIFSLPLLLLPAWLIVGIGLQPLRSIAEQIESRAVSDLTALPDSQYRELSPLVDAINRLMMRLSQRIEREHEFLTDAAHELKTPLAAIQINAHLLLSRSVADNPARSAEAGQGLRDGVARATHMVHQLLAFERARAEPSAEPLPLTELSAFVRSRLALAVPLAMQRGIEIEFQAEGECRMAVHVESMAALLDNLISNAVKYSPEHGRIVVGLAVAGEGCQLTISDQGPGIAQALQQKVFERFYRVPGQEQSGSGLGLAIAERAAERNQGSIALSSDGNGLTVTVEFRGQVPHFYTSS
ncbi:two-component sensor histidine kinase [Duganella sp. FT135W]|uniref:histidine kinase n=1 Tax=Duganella flavida TaxID=2692175 RepID=A0A6L8KI18_9BURK|nr:HAMP domain-containing sensor histidine kinase [Duganella flavida]MYM25422.1 two-component sensor histidine kinase [Duganella flavida]